MILALTACRVLQPSEPVYFADKKRAANKQTIAEAGESSIYFSGLTHLLSQRKEKEDHVTVLLPDASDPFNNNINDKTWFFTAQHEARLVLFVGQPEKPGQWSVAERCRQGNQTKWQAIDLSGKQLYLAGTGVELDRSPADPHSPGSLFLLADMDELKEPNWRIAPSLVAGCYEGKDIAARVVIESGSLSTAGAWGDSMSTIKKFKFFEWIGRSAGSSKKQMMYMATSLKLDLASADKVDLVLCDLATLTVCETVSVKSLDDNLILAIENAPVPRDCKTKDAHFAAHFMVFRPQKIKKVYVPGTVDLFGSSHDNAQCSPVESSWP